MSSRDEVISYIRAMSKRTGRHEFQLREIVKGVMESGTRYQEHTIRRQITSGMCAKSPSPHFRTYGDLVRTGRGTYRLAAHGSRFRAQEQAGGKSRTQSRPPKCCCPRFRESVEHRLVAPALLPDETEWFIPGGCHIYYCPFCGKNIKGKGTGDYDQKQRKA